MRRLFALLVLSASCAAAPPFDAQAIEKASGLKGAWIEAEGVFKVTQPRADVEVTVDGAPLPPFAGLTSWAAFQAGKDGKAMVMGDLVLFADEIDAAMSAALDAGLSVTALHNHFASERPRVFFMHIGGEGEAEALAAGVGKALAAVRKVREGTPHPDGAAAGRPFPAKSAIDGKGLEAILGAAGTAKDGMWKMTIGRTATMDGCGCAVGKEMGVNTWAAFVGTDADAAVDGDFVTSAGELQPVLRALRGAGISVVAIHSHMEGESPRLIFLHYWGRGAAADLARGVRAGLDAQRGAGGRLLVALEQGGAVMLDPRTGAVLSRHDTGADAFGAAFSRDGARAFVTDKAAGTLVELRGPSVVVGAGAQQPAVAADGRVFVPLSGEAAIAVVKDGKVLRRIATGAGSKPHIVSLSPDGEWLWATVQGVDARVVAVRVTPEGEEAPRDFRNDLVPRVVCAVRGGAWFTAHHSTGLHFASLEDGKVSTPWVDRHGEFSEPRKQIEGVDASPDGRRVAVTHEGRRALVVLERDASGLRAVADVAPLSQNPYWVTLDPAAGVAFVSIPGDGAVEAWDLGASRRLWRAEVGGKAKRMALAGGAPR